MDAWSIVGFIQSGLLWILAGVSLLWIFRRIEDAAAVRLLSPVLILQAVTSLIWGYVIAMELFVARYSGAIYTAEATNLRLNGPYWWVYWLLFAAPLVSLAFLIPRVRRSMPVVAGISLFAFSVVCSGLLLGMAKAASP
ncbi:hypothetical protein OKA05_26300 [Luteolibacter arcticus]|uniref:Uncharacterized protein n=1 Tax=Luteolibacter arcticus TaxID=1581411 RepID=A0ABT3GRF3_9BACT|nr:hypothetical protein [Luteolibacter arcticus]MCW1926098.1 hypothetical protein [Luteolibacter arcticus]